MMKSSTGPVCDYDRLRGAIDNANTEVQSLFEQHGVPATSEGGIAVIVNHGYVTGFRLRYSLDLGAVCIDDIVAQLLEIMQALGLYGEVDIQHDQDDDPLHVTFSFKFNT